MLDPLPSRFQTNPRWEFQERRTTGICIISRSGAILCRIEPPFTLWMWDKRAGCEVPIDVRDLPLYESVSH